MWWMWIVGPVVIALIWLTTSFRDRRREVEVERWRALMASKVAFEKVSTGYRDVGLEPVEKKGPAPRVVNALPGALQRVVNAAGGGDAFGHYELVPKLAYVSVMAANATVGSDLQAVVGKLEADAPAFIVRPLPVIEGERMANTGIDFKKDPEFVALFQVDAVDVTAAPAGGKAPAPTEAETAKKIRSWLSRPVREALRDMPDAWLYVQGRAMALVLYGLTDAEKLHELVTVGDVIFAEYGEDGGPSLFGDDDEDDVEEAAPPPPPKKSKSSAKTASAKG